MPLALVSGMFVFFAVSKAPLALVGLFVASLGGVILLKVKAAQQVEIGQRGRLRFAGPAGALLIIGGLVFAGYVVYAARDAALEAAREFMLQHGSK